MSDIYSSEGGSYQQNAEQVAEDASDLQAQLKKLREDLTALASSVAAIGKEKAASYGAKVASEAVEASQGAMEDYATFQEAVSERIRARPLQAVGVAAGIGYLIAAMRR